MLLNIITLQCRAECHADALKVLNEASANSAIQQCVRDIELKTTGLVEPELTFSFAVSVPNKQPLYDAVKALVQIIESTDDAHVMAQTLNFASEYDGSRLDSKLTDRFAVPRLKEHTVGVEVNAFD